ncbi:MAG: crosslink repair DNA glycosylase YcaQ family protein [Pseudomonadota bacterium]
MTRPTLSTSDARRLFMVRQGLAAPSRSVPSGKLNASGLARVIEDLGFVQVDSINTLARAHDLILFSRNRTYRPKLLAQVLERDRLAFENWTHDASIIPMAFYPYWQTRFHKERVRLKEAWRKWRREGFEEALLEVEAHVRAHGPTMARHLGGEQKKGSANGWWDWHPTKTALEYLWRCGQLSVCRREGFQKVYDLCDRVIPDDHLTPEVTHQETVDWACNGALDRLGLATSGELAAFWDLVSPAEAAAWCRVGHHAGDLIEVEVDGADGGKARRAYTRPETLENLSELPDLPKRMRVLSPFDPLIRDRKRLQRLFNFDYRIEVFVPAAKRRYGYYVFPLLEGDRLVGRIDMKNWRDEAEIRVSGLWLEPKIRLTKDRQRRLDAELDRLRRFVGAERVTYLDGYLKT